MKRYHFELSEKPNKKFKVWHDEVGFIHFGHPHYEHYKTSHLIPKELHVWPEHRDLKRRRLYRARASKIRDKDGNLTYLDDTSPNFYSFNFLW